jgi:hypothetical protein
MKEQWDGRHQHYHHGDDQNHKRNDGGKPLRLCGDLCAVKEYPVDPRLDFDRRHNTIVRPGLIEFLRPCSEDN